MATSIRKTVHDILGPSYRANLHSMVHEGVENVVIGGLAGLAAAKGKLDAKIGHTQVPVDLAAGVALTLLPSFARTPRLLHNIGERLLTVAAFRKANAWAGGRHTAGVHGEIDEGTAGLGGGRDPILDIAAAL